VTRSPGKRRLPRFTRAQVRDGVTRFMILLALVVVGYVLIQYREFAECTARYNDAQAVSTRARAAAADRDRAAEDALWQAVADSGNPQVVPPDQAQKHIEKAFALFIQQRNQAREERARNPLPPGPSQVCR
jgi:hypothetical protein